jgi:hypothetical protein
MLLAAAIVLAAWTFSSCSPSGFTSETLINSVRILASRANEPRAKPGDSVHLEVLAYDGRASQPQPMNLFWLPFPCINPKGDAYYACFASIGTGHLGDDAGAAGGTGGGSDAGTGSGGSGGLASLLRPGVDLTPVLVSGSTFDFTMPDDVIVPREGVSPSYGLAIIFNFACAGHLELVPYDPASASPQQIPIGCFDSNHVRLGSDDFVFGYTRVYAYEKTEEVNPVISQVDVAGARLAIDGGVSEPFVVPLCDKPNTADCAKKPIGPVVSPSPPSGKLVWADFYSTTGSFGSGARLLYDPSVTLSIPDETNNKFTAPQSLMGAPAQNFIFIVVHDDQGGADWVTVPLQLQDAGAPDAGAPQL